MSQAFLDYGTHRGEYGKLSDPTLYDAVGILHPNTQEELAILRSHILRSFPSLSLGDRHARAELEAMLFGAPLHTEGEAA